MTNTTGIQTVLHPVTDLAKAKEVYSALLGVEPTADSPYYVGYEAEGQQIGLVPNSTARSTPASSSRAMCRVTGSWTWLCASMINGCSWSAGIPRPVSNLPTVGGSRC
ncbi:VOC family protein [Kibdelosporangium lantanae]|uniref:VOC family protein n=1 Tax=Kibdelosporangium lantanae TaxID=1497396 RepID=A0ABW3M6G6_9PSEU